MPLLTQVSCPGVEDLEDRLALWTVALQAAGRSPQTVRTYTAGVRAFLAWAANQEHATDLDRASVAAFTAHLLAAGAQPATANSRHRAVRRFAAWCAAEDGQPDPLAGMAQPRLDRKVVPVLTTAQLAALLRACAGRSMRDRRDEALVRLMTETGARAGEILAMNTTDIDLTHQTAVIRRGKGGKGRIVPYSPQCALAIGRYLRLRRAHPLAASPALWLGDRGRGFAYYGLNDALKARAQAAGIAGFHLHVLRHTAASRWLAAGGSEGGLMAVAGWSSRDMIDRYTAHTAAARAADEARTLNLGDL
jgi:site-specific recombinase XerD